MYASWRVQLAALLLLALLAPVQSVLAAAVPVSQGTHESCPAHPRHEQGGDVQHSCGCCCLVAIDSASPWLDLPRICTPPSALPAPRSPHELARDRLDRPPR